MKLKLFVFLSVMLSSFLSTNIMASSESASGYNATTTSAELPTITMRRRGSDYEP
ncbi:MAG: hypothetical protein VSS52_004820 [Thiotrichaceae bacterium]|nr:hypothetical protein [Thiotrichaceae bacterium]